MIGHYRLTGPLHSFYYNKCFGEVVVAQLLEWLLLIPEVRGSTQVIGIIYFEHLFVFLFIINYIEKTKINKKRPGMAHFFKCFEIIKEGLD